MQAILTKHALKRCKERCGWGHEASQRMATMALQDGLQHADARGGLKRYFDALYLTERSANNLRIYGRHVFVFCDDRLITVQYLERKFERAVDALSAAKIAKEMNGKSAPESANKQS